jgi:hypothetical protein
MFLVPYRRIQFHTNLDPVTIARRLETVVESRFHWFRWPKGKEFSGRVSPNGFRLMRIIRGQNTYLPWLLGWIERARTSGSKVVIVMTLHPVAVVLTLGFLVLVMYGVFTHARFFWEPLTIFGGFHVFMYAFGFRPEARRAERRLRELLAAGQQNH